MLQGLNMTPRIGNQGHRSKKILSFPCGLWYTNRKVHRPPIQRRAKRLTGGAIGFSPAYRPK